MRIGAVTKVMTHTEKSLFRSQDQQITYVAVTSFISEQRKRSFNLIDYDLPSALRNVTIVPLTLVWIGQEMMSVRSHVFDNVQHPPWGGPLFIKQLSAEKILTEGKRI